MLCEYHWKIDKLFKESFSGWKPASPIEVEDEDEDAEEVEAEVDGAHKFGETKRST